ncbi:MAG: hypothetical protein HY862_18875 [Chloroflexi bacterium]|nr:hypothetical protein [Chloroflexota bacterium]
MPEKWGAFPLIIGGLALLTAIFLLISGVGPHAMPFMPEAKFSDAVTSHWPNALFLQRSIREDGTLPLWRNQIMSGQPFAANPLNKVWYPPQWLVVLLPVTLSLNLLIWLTLITAGAGAWLWARQTGLEKIPAALVAFGYAFAPRLLAAVGAGHLDVLYAISWQAWLYWSVWRLIHLPQHRRRESLLLAIFTALIFLSDVRLAAYIYMMALAYAIYLIAHLPEKNLRPIMGWASVAGGLAILLTAVQWLPLLDLTPDLSRNRISEAEAGISSIEPGEFLSLMIANHEADPEKMLYVGVGVFLLALVALVGHPRQMGFWASGVVMAAWWGMGQNSLLWTSAVRLFPSLLWFRVPARAWLIVALVLPYMAGWGLQWIGEISQEALKKRAVRLAAVGTLSFSAVCWISSLVALAEALPIEALVGLIALPLSVGLILLGAWRLIPIRTFQGAFVLLMLVDVLWVGHSMVEWRNQREWLDDYRPLAEMLKADGVERVYSPSYSLPQQAAAYWRIPQFDGVDPFQLDTYVQEAERITGVKAKGYSVTIPAFDLPDDADEDDLATINQNAVIDVQGLANWRVTHVASAFEIQADGLEQIGKIREVYVYRNTLIAQDVRITWHGPNRVSMSPVNSNIYAFAKAPNWKESPEGKYQYAPKSQYLGMVFSGIGLIGIITLAFAQRKTSHV